MKPIKLLLILFFIWCSGALVTGALLSAQPKLDVSGDIDTPSLALTPQTAAPTQPRPEGQIYYNKSSDNVYISDGANWKDIAIPKYVATIIVAASDSLDPNKADPAYRCNGAGDGTGDQTEINAAITATAAVGGGAVYLLEGTYEITGAINMTRNISLIGAGSGTVLKIPDGTNATFNVINTPPAPASLYNLLISKLRIDGNKANVSGTISGISFSGVTYSKVDNVWIENMRTTGISIAGSSSNNIISHNSIQLNILDGISLTSSSNNSIINNNVQLNGNRGVVFTGSSNNLISGNNIQGNIGRGIYIYSSSNNNLISGNNIQSNSERGIYIYSSSNNNLISGNNIQSNIGEGIKANKSSNNNNIIANHISDNGNGYNGIKIDDDSDNNLISSNYIYDVSDATNSGIDITIATCENNYLAANYITGSFPTKISDSGTGTKYTGKDKITLEPVTVAITGAAAIDPTNPPASHVVFNNTSGATQALTLADGKAAGDTLILENTSVNSVTISESTSNINLSTAHQPIATLGQYDTLELIWDSLSWVEVSFTNVP